MRRRGLFSSCLVSLKMERKHAKSSEQTEGDFGNGRDGGLSSILLINTNNSRDTVTDLRAPRYKYSRWKAQTRLMSLLVF